MKTVIPLILSICLFSLGAYGGDVQFRRTAGGLQIGTSATDKLSFYDVGAPVVQPANTQTIRQAMEALGLIATGGSDTANTDALSKVADDTIADGVDFTLGGSSGTKIGTSATAQKLGFFNATPVVQPLSANQTALTDSTGGAVSDATLAAGVGVTTVAIPIQLAAMTTSAADLVTAYTPGYKFKVLAVDFATTTIGAGTSASQTLNLAIGATALTGGVINPTLTGTDTLGKLTAGSSVTAANSGTASDTISLKVADSGTVFTGGAGVVLVKLQNMDTADSFAKTAKLANALRTGLVNLGLIKGSN